MKKPMPMKPPMIRMGMEKKAVPGAPAPKNLPTPRTAQAPMQKVAIAADSAKKEALKRMLPKKGK
jgi:hypothetical protein